MGRPAVVQGLAAVQDIEARGFLRGVGRLILIIIVVLVVIGAVLGFLVARIFNRRR
jgi:hypothetical protein